MLKQLIAAVVAAAAVAGVGVAEQRGAGFVDVREVMLEARLDVRYFTPYNFVGEPIDGYLAPLCLLTREAAAALQRAQAAFARHGYAVKIFDCYRPQSAVNHFVRWAEDVDDTRMKALFYPSVDKSKLFEKGYIAARSSHSRGSTVDLTLVPLDAPPQTPYRAGQPFVDNGIDMGTMFDYFDPLSHTDNPAITGEARRNRQLLKSVMEDSGFAHYPKEWWHFTLRDEPHPETYFDFPVR